MKRIMAQRTGDGLGWERQSFGEKACTVQLEIHDDNTLHTQWGPVRVQAMKGERVHLVACLHPHSQAESFMIPACELQRLQEAANWQWLPQHRAYRRTLPWGYAILVKQPKAPGQQRGDYLLPTIYQATHWYETGEIVMTTHEFVSPGGNETAFDKASTWSQQVEHAELCPWARLHFIPVELAIGTHVKILKGSINDLPARLEKSPRSLKGKEAVIVAEWNDGRQWYSQRVGSEVHWECNTYWYVECDGEQLRFSMQGGEEISASSYVLSELDAHGQVTRETHYHEADRAGLFRRLDSLETQHHHGTILLPSQDDLQACFPHSRFIDLTGYTTP